MKTYLECIPCFVKQALRVGQISTNDETKIKEILNITGKMIPKIPMQASPPEISKMVYDEIKVITKNEDPYKEIKLHNIEKAKELVPHMKEIIDKDENPLFEAARMAIAGNVIDFGIYESVNIEKEIMKSIETDLTINDFDDFVEKLETVKNILYIGDNTAEAVFDKLFIEQLGKPVKFVVRGKPILNDITESEAKLIGIDDVAEVISSGTSAPGNILSDCTSEFLNIMDKADLIISKGQGNFEALSDTNYQIFFFLKAKCNVIARDIGVDVGSLLLMQNKKN